MLSSVLSSEDTALNKTKSLGLVRERQTITNEQEGIICQMVISATKTKQNKTQILSKKDKEWLEGVLCCTEWPDG